MTGDQKQQVFYVQDPFTETVQGPMTVGELRKWFAGGSFGGWGVSKSPNGPWTLASDVKGLSPPKAADVEAPTPTPLQQTGPAKAASVARKSEMVADNSTNLWKAVALITVPILALFVFIFMQGSAFFGSGSPSTDNANKSTVATPDQANETVDKDAAMESVAKPTTSGRELRRYASKIEQIFEKIQKTYANIDNMKLKDAAALHNDLTGEFAALPKCPDPHFDSVDKSIKVILIDLRSIAQQMTGVLEVKIVEAQAQGNSEVLGYSRNIEQQLQQSIAKLRASAGQEIQRLKDDPILNELFDHL